MYIQTRSRFGNFGLGGSALSMNLQQAQEDCQKASADLQAAKAAKMPSYLIERASTKASARCKHAASLKAGEGTSWLDIKPEPEKESGFWPGITDMFKTILPVAGSAWQATQWSPGFVPQPQPQQQQPTVIVQEGGSNTGLLIGLGVAGLAIVAFLLIRRG